MSKSRAPAPKRRLIVPLVLAVTTVGAVVALTSGAGCGDDLPPRADAGAGDAMVDTPIV